MKALFPSLLLSLASFAVVGDVVVTLPSPQQLEMFVCANGYLTKDYKITSVDPSTGFLSGVVFEQNKCTTRSGKVTVTGYHSTCADVVWDGNGLIQSVDVTGSYAGRIAQSIAICS